MDDVLRRYTLPTPPSGNRYWRHIVIGGQARTVLSREAKEFRAKVAAAVGKTTPMAGRLSVVLDWYRPARRGDLDNAVKQPLDALQAAGVFANDGQIVFLWVRMHEDKLRPRLEVLVTKAGAEHGS